MQLLKLDILDDRAELLLPQLQANRRGRCLRRLWTGLIVTTNDALHHVIRLLLRLKLL